MEDIGKDYNSVLRLVPSHAALGGVAPGEGTWLPEFIHVMFDDGCSMTCEKGVGGVTEIIRPMQECRERGGEDSTTRTCNSEKFSRERLSL